MSVDILKEFQKKLTSVNTISDLYLLKNEFLGKDSELMQLFKNIKNIPENERGNYGKKLNEIKSNIELILNEKLIEIKESSLKSNNSYELDVTAPYDINSKNRPKRLTNKGTLNPLLTEIEKVSGILEKMGYIVEDSRTLDDDWHVFESLNIPKGHPARDMWDTFWTEEGFIPTTHTSNMQIRILKKYKHLLDKGQPIAVIVPGRCFRNEATDFTHEHTFYQIEMIYVSTNATIGNLAGTMKKLLEVYYEKEDIKIQMQPSYFPFVEPGIQFLNECLYCGQKGCRICKYTGWMEILGCGYIHPVVLENAGIDSYKYCGYAFGPGIGRLVMLKHQIKDNRWFLSGDLRFLEQF